MNGYDPFVRGPFAVGVRTVDARDTARERSFPCEIWYPASSLHRGQDLSSPTQDVFTLNDKPCTQSAVRDAAANSGKYPLIIYSHPSMFHRRAATFLCTHLSSHGYVVAALDHSEVVVRMGPKQGETEEQKAARYEAVIASRVPDIRFLLDQLLRDAVVQRHTTIDPNQIGIVGHSLGGWTALTVPDVEPRIRAVVALAPGGASNPRPGILPAKLDFSWGRDVPTLYLVAENDVPLPLAGMVELFDRTPGSKQMMILRRADHAHFMDNVEELHESFRTMTVTGPLLEFQKETRPISELCSGAQAHLFTRGLTLAHMDATLSRKAEAQRFLAGDLKGELEARSVEVLVHEA
jgi:dienelactone hydrolase